MASFKKVQQQFHDYCRKRINSLDFHVSRKDALPHYPRLVYNIFYYNLLNAYPITATYLGEEWETLVTLFLKKHDCHTHFIWLLPQEFLSFVEDQPYYTDKFPVLLDLMRWEWASLYVQIMQDVEIPSLAQECNSLEAFPFVNPYQQPLLLHYPVFRLSPFEAERHPQKTLLIAYRTEELKSHYLQLHLPQELLLAAYHLLKHLLYHNGKLSLLALSQYIALYLQNKDPLPFTLQLLNVLAEKGLLWGFRKD